MESAPLSEPTHTILYNKLRDEWFAEMGVLDCSKEYFYNKQEYATFRSVYEHPVDWEEPKKTEAPKTQVPGKTESQVPRGMLARGLYCLKTQGLVHTMKLVIRKVFR